MQSWCFYIRYEIENDSCRSSIRGIFVSSLKCYQFGECFRQKEVIRSTVVLKKDANFFTRFGKSLIFQLLLIVFDYPYGSTDSFILVVSPYIFLPRVFFFLPWGFSFCREVILLPWQLWATVAYALSHKNWHKIYIKSKGWFLTISKKVNLILS